MTRDDKNADVIYVYFLERVNGREILENVIKKIKREKFDEKRCSFNGEKMIKWNLWGKN